LGAPGNFYIREDEILRRIALGVEHDDGLGSTQDVADVLRSNAMVVEVYGPGRWAVTATQ
jgi:hypothetical protein